MDALAHPQVLTAAWMRVDAWYRSGNLDPEPELSRWRLHPERELRFLGAELREGAWKPHAWTQLPYPKKGARLRHYVQPTVRDQVAFMAHVVLLGPLVDSQIPPFAFGNRWYRPVVWDRRREKPGWQLLRYPLLTRRTFLPYARDHGMFRRVAHWTAARMLKGQLQKEDYAGRVQHPEDHDQEVLPPWLREDWWDDSGSDVRRISWAALDIQLAYPCVQLDRLRHILHEMTDDVMLAEFDSLLTGYPATVLTALNDPDVRHSIVDSAVFALKRVHLGHPKIACDTWNPSHPRGHLPGGAERDDLGIPTGLAVSGFLFNAALHKLDRGILAHLESQTPHSGAFVRFADDMYVLALSPDALFGLIEAVWRGLADDPNLTLADARSKTNLYLNLDKVRPPAVRDALVSYLCDHGWTCCPECDSWDPPQDPERRSPFHKWWATDQSRREPHDEALRRSSVGRTDLGPFVTALVERLSEIGTDTLKDRFGNASEERLGRLHELARFDIDDEQVRPDTRRTFAANRLVQAWLPVDTGQAEPALAEIRASIAHVLQRTPWKFSLWRAVVRAAARRTRTDDLASEHETAQRWLTDQLCGIATQPATPDRENSLWWPDLWPEDLREKHPRGGDWRALYLSFHRAAFWHALADTLRALWRHVERTKHPRMGEAELSPMIWTVRAVPTECLFAVTQFLGAIEKWAQVLYGERRSDVTLMDYPWEADQLVVAVLASKQRTELAKAFLHAPSTHQLLTVPGPLLEQVGARVTALLRAAGRVSQHQLTREPLDTVSLAHVGLGGADRRLGRFLFPRPRAARIRNALRQPQHVIAVSAALGCTESIGPEFTDGVVLNPSDFVKALREDPLAFEEYHQARRIRLGAQGGEP